MIRGKNGVTAVVLSLKAADMVLTFIQHPNGGLSQGDDSSATKVLEEVRAASLRHLQQGKKVSAPIQQMEALVKRFPELGRMLPSDLKSKLDYALSHMGEMKTLQEDLAKDISEIDKLLDFARLYDGIEAGEVGAAPVGDDVEQFIESLMDKIFPGSNELPEEEIQAGDTVIGCGTPGCEGCGGRKVFKFEPGASKAGLMNLGNIAVPASNPTGLPAGIEDKLKAIFGGDVQIVQVGGKRSHDPLQGLSEALVKALSGNKSNLH